LFFHFHIGFEAHFLKRSMLPDRESANSGRVKKS